ncbi:MAG: hypothetical protein ACNI27_00780 [Desulfovibrio sp.]
MNNEKVWLGSIVCVAGVNTALNIGGFGGTMVSTIFAIVILVIIGMYLVQYRHIRKEAAKKSQRMPDSEIAHMNLHLGKILVKTDVMRTELSKCQGEGCKRKENIETMGKAVEGIRESTLNSVDRLGGFS